MDIQSKAAIALVTGASRGIGAAIAEVLAVAGFQVALLARDVEALAKLELRLASLGARARAFGCDVTDEASVNAALARVEEELGTPTVLVNNAGVGGPFHRADEVSRKEWDDLFGVNVDSIHHFCRQLLPRMKERGFGRVVNISSIQGMFGGALSSTYAATKHAVVGYSRSVAAEWGPYGITCNAVCPGYTETEVLLKVVQGEVKKELLRRIPARRLCTPEEVGQLVAFLVGPFGGYINGTTLMMDGGLSAHLAGDLPSF